MKKIYLFFLASLLLLPAGLLGQAGMAQFSGVNAEKRGDNVYITATYDLADLDLKKQNRIMVTPVLRSADRAHSVVFDPVMIIGKTRHKALKRAMALDGYQLEKEPAQTIVFHKKEWAPVSFNLTTPYQPWMRQAELVFEEELCGCLNEVLADNEYRLIPRILPPLYVPTYQVTYVEPPTEEVKQRSESYAARLNFQVNRYEILHNFMNNAAVLNEVDKIIGEVKNDPNLTITEFKVTGYASPEGNANSNMTLSENRAKAFVTYVQNKHAIPRNAMQVDWKGDDWDGLRKLMEESNFTDKNRVLDILNGTTDSQQRKNQLRNMGTAYRTLLTEYYPYLRRNEYTIAYIARPFSVQEAKSLIKTKPQQLSLNEMFLVANSYPKGSPDFKEVFDIAVRLYPTSEFANMNSGTLDIENGAYDVALDRLMRVNMPEAWNNIGYIYIQKKDYNKAAEYFKRAADAGLQLAKDNLSELNKWLADPE